MTQRGGLLNIAAVRACVSGMMLCGAVCTFVRAWTAEREALGEGGDDGDGREEAYASCI